jgi:ribonucleoside-diphosphate reductase subunit M2
MWTKEEIHMGDDTLADVTPEEARVVLGILSFFSTADNIVMENINANFASEITWSDVRYYLGFQLAIEGVHAAVYAALLEQLVPDDAAREALVYSGGGNAVVSAAMRKKEWATKWMNADRPLAERIVAFTLVEGLLFSAAFAFIAWLGHKYPGKRVLYGLVKSNEFIQRDENLHAVFHGQTLYGCLERPAAPHTVRAIVEDAVATEDNFVDTVFDDALGMDKSAMKQYVRLQADTILQWLGNEALYKVENPFPWMSHMALNRQENFFEGIPAYTKVRVNEDAVFQAIDGSEDPLDF